MQLMQQMSLRSSHRHCLQSRVNRSRKHVKAQRQWKNISPSPLRSLFAPPYVPRTPYVTYSVPYLRISTRKLLVRWRRRKGYIYDTISHYRFPQQVGVHTMLRR